MELSSGEISVQKATMVVVSENVRCSLQQDAGRGRSSSLQVLKCVKTREACHHTDAIADNLGLFPC